uniref:translation initiation factor 2 n=1 Tax=Anunuuluaehu liula TaxID=3049639 RepID=UPI003001EB0E
MIKNMTNNFLYTYNLFQIKTRIYSFNYCVSVEKEESVLVLENPQLVCIFDQTKTNKNTRKNLIIDTSFKSINEGDSNSAINFTTKFDKKNKNTSRLHNDLEDKKSKIKQKKKVRSKILLDNDEIFIENNHSRITNSNDDPINISLLRPSKPYKQKRKYKAKQNVLNNSVSVSSKSNTKSLKVFNVNSRDENKELVKKEIVLDSPLTIQQLADKLQVSEAAIITWLFLKGISVTINQVVDISIASEVAMHYNFIILDSYMSQKSNSFQDNNTINSIKDGTKRAPIIAIFGHVDHGKTTLLDCIRKTNLVAAEAGGITQSIAGYEVEFEYLSSIEKLVFLDTPGHEAFTSMRLRGAQVTDLAILVVAADDGLKPQSIEAIDYISNRKIPYVVAINKIDKPDINITKLKEQLANYNIVDKDWGGSSTIVEVSALTGQNIDILLSAICELSEQQALKANSNSLAEGTILEAHLDKKTGPIANLVIRNGTLNVGDIIVSGDIYGRIKIIIDSFGKKIKHAKPSSIVNVWGFSSVPQAGSNFQVAQDDKNAKYLISTNNSKSSDYNMSKLLSTRVTLESYSNKSNLKQINLIIKTDTQGSIEAIINSFSQIPQDKVQINILSATSGSISDTDIDLAITSQSIILGFNIQVSSNIYKTAEKSGVTISTFTVIYNLLDYVKQYMLSLIDIEYDKVEIGKATVQTVFHINKGTVAGCIVNSGKLRKNAHIMIYRNQDLIHNGLLSSLKRMKDDVDEVIAGNECGVMCDNYNEWAQFDILEAYELIQTEKFL